MFEKISNQASIFVRHANKKTLDARAMQSAVRLILPGELAKHSVAEGTKAVNKTFYANK